MPYLTAWNRRDEKALARYCTNKLPQSWEPIRDWEENLRSVEGRRRLAKLLYERLQAIGITYSPPPYSSQENSQEIRTQDEILISQKQGTCLDLMVLFCGLCLAHHLMPLALVHEGHAYTAVCLTQTTNEVTHVARAGAAAFASQNGLAPKDKYTQILELFEEGNFIAIECTGFARWQGSQQEYPEGRGRTDSGLMSFERSLEAGQEQLQTQTHEFLFALDIDQLVRLFGVGPQPTARSVPYGTHEEEAIKAALARISVDNLPEIPSFTDISRFLDLPVGLKVMRAAALQWLQPATDQGLEDIKAEIGLSHISDKIFCPKLTKACNKIAQELPELDLWVRRCNALLEFTTALPFVMPPPLAGLGVRHDFDLLEIASYRHIDAGATATQANDVLEKSLFLAGYACAAPLSSMGEGQRSRFDVNLMLPILKTDLYTSRLFGNAVANRNFEISSRLWRSAPETDLVLAVVAEYGKAKNFGFWLPLDIQTDSPSVGAREAYRTGRASTVFTNDLPPFTKDLFHDTYDEWKAYIASLKIDLFVSVPFAVEEGTQNRHVLAILNVNVRSDKKGDFRRAYHSPWLDIAQETSNPFIREAYKAFTLAKSGAVRVELSKLMAPDSPYPLLDITGSKR